MHEIEFLVVVAMQVLLPSAELVVKILLGFVVGALIGLERQKKMESERVAGVRSFGLHSLLGTLTAYAYEILSEPVILVYAIVISGILVATQIYYKMFRTMGRGLTTPLVFAISFVLGVLVGLDIPAEGQYIGTLGVFAMTVSFGVFLVLSFKEELAHAVEVITRDEMISAVELGVIILFLWPIIPQTVQIGIIELPLFQIYLLIVILLGVSFANYLLVKKYKDRGVYFFGLFGGLANSEAAVSSVTDFYVKSERKGIGRISGSVLLANVAMVLRNGFLLLLIDWTFFLFRLYLIPIAILLVASMTKLLLESRKQGNLGEPMFDTRLVSPFEFGPALRFGAIFTGVYLVQLIFTATFSDIGLVVAALIGGIVSAGAVVASAATLFVTGEVTLSIAANAVIIATTMSVLNKMIYVYLADRETTLLRTVARDSVIVGSLILFYLLLLSLGLLV
ncbi:MAG: MgtC/SapB family protein [Candidatus Thorarchaeota archaeon]